MEQAPTSLLDTGRRIRPIETLEERHDDLSDLRDNLLGYRFNLMAQRERLRRLRFRSSEKDGELISLLRQVFSTTGGELPEQVSECWMRMNELRDELSLAEVEYERIEEDYDEVEWSYTERESEYLDEVVAFAKDQSSNGKVSEEAVERLAAPEISANYTGLHDPWTYLVNEGLVPEIPAFPSLDMLDVELASPYSPLQQTQSRSPDVASDESKQSLLRGSGTSTQSFERDHPFFVVSQSSTVSSSAKTHSIDLSHQRLADGSVPLMWLDAERRIDDWLLSILLDSIHQQALFMQMLPGHTLEVDAWRPLIMAHWERGEPDMDFWETDSMENSLDNSDSESGTPTVNIAELISLEDSGKSQDLHTADPNESENTHGMRQSSPSPRIGNAETHYQEPEDLLIGLRFWTNQPRKAPSISSTGFRARRPKIVLRGPSRSRSENGDWSYRDHGCIRC